MRRPFIAFSFLALVTLFIVTARAADPATQPTTMPTRKPAPLATTQALGIPLYPAGVPGSLGNADTDNPTLFVFPAPKDKANGTAIIVCPGGGYGHLAMPHEGYDVAKWLNDHGVTAFVLRYRFAPYKHPIPLNDGLRAMRIIRSRAAEWNIAPGKLGMLGFSAGGHLTSSVGTHFDLGKPDAADALDRVSSRPDFLVLVYPVISMEPGTTHGGSRKNLIGDDADKALTDLMSNNKQVTDNTPPTFLTHSKTDPAVPVKNSELFHDALLAHHVPTEMVLFDHGGHGWGLSVKDKEIATWTDKCLEWLTKQNLLSQK